jgi:hypothetical protein
MFGLMIRRSQVQIPLRYRKRSRKPAFLFGWNNDRSGTFGQPRVRRGPAVFGREDLRPGKRSESKVERLSLETTSERFYVIADATSGRGEISSTRPTRSDVTYETEYREAGHRRLGAAPTCPVCGVFIGMRTWLPPFRVELTLHGAEWGDFAFGAGSDFLVSARVAAAFTEAGLTGLSLDPVEVVSARGSRLPPPQYFRAEPVRSEAAIDEQRSNILRSKNSVYCGRCGADLDGIKGFVVKTGTWPGEDAFEVRNLRAVPIASGRFRRLADANGFTNVRFIPTASFAWDPYEPVG